jgi:hypothetical protein
MMLFKTELTCERVKLLEGHLDLCFTPHFDPLHNSLSILDHPDLQPRPVVSPVIHYNKAAKTELCGNQSCSSSHIVCFYTSYRSFRSTLFDNDQDMLVHPLLIASALMATSTLAWNKGITNLLHF